MKTLLEARVGKMKAEGAVQSEVSPEEALRRADSGVRDANAKHDQGVVALVKVREVLQKASEGASAVALALAQAERSKKAAQALAIHLGVVPSSPSDSEAPSKDNNDFITIQRGEVFQEL